MGGYSAAKKARNGRKFCLGRNPNFRTRCTRTTRIPRHCPNFSASNTNVFSIVMFWGDCEFKTPMPPNVMAKGYASYIKSHTTVLFSDQQVEEIVAAIRGGMLKKSWATQRQHVEALKERFSSSTTCPKCGSALVLRTARAGANAGSQFYGCTKYPACRYTAKAERHS